MATEPEHAVVHRPEHSRYELMVDGSVAGVIGYEDVRGVRVLRHTVIREAYEGRGLASELVRNTLAQIVADGGKFAATCPYITHWLTKNHEYDGALVAAPSR